MRGKALSLSWFIEDVKATTVEHEPERTVRRSRREKVQCSEAAAQIAALHFGAGLFDGERRDINSEYIEAPFGQPNCICAGTRANLKCPGWRDPAGSDELDEQGLWLSGIPGQLSRSVAFIPWTV